MRNACPLGCYYCGRVGEGASGVPSAPRLPGGARGKVEAGWGHPALPVPGGLVKIALADSNLFDFCSLRDE